MAAKAYMGEKTGRRGCRGKGGAAGVAWTAGGEEEEETGDGTEVYHADDDEDGGFLLGHEAHYATFP